MSIQVENKFKIIGILLFLLVLLINPFVVQQLTVQYYIFSLLFLVFGLGCYFNFFGLGKKVIGVFKYFESHNGWWLLMTQAAIYIFYLLLNQDLLSYQLHAGSGDGLSYTGFDFSSWTSALGSIRTVGLPVILKIYGLVFQNFHFWPHFQRLSYILSVFFLYGCFLRFGFNRIFALLVVSLLLWDNADNYIFCDAGTEVFAAVFLQLTIGSMLLAIRNWNWKTAVSLGVSTFFLYQIRPNFAFIPILVPLWAVGISVIKETFLLARARNIFFRFSLVTILPLFLFCLLRLLVVEQFGVVSMSGGCLAGHAVHYLNEENIQHLSGDVRMLADEILVRKRQLTPPNNLSPFEWITFVSEEEKVEMEANAFGPNLMTSWDVAIRHLRGVEPFPDPKQNIEPWKHTLTLSGFHTQYYNFETDRLLMRFSIAVLTREWKRYVHWLVGGTFYGMREYCKSRSWLPWLGFLGIIKLTYFLLANGWDVVRLKCWHRDIAIFLMIAGSIFVFGFIPIIVFNYPFARLFDWIGIYLLPAVLCFTLPPFWLKREAA